MPEPSPSNSNQYGGGYKIAIPPGKPKRLLVAMYEPADPQPEYNVSCNPDDQSVAHHFFSVEQRGRLHLYCQFENYGLKTVEVTLRRLRIKAPQLPPFEQLR